MLIDILTKFPPSVNSYYLSVGGARGVRRISSAGRAFRQSVAEDVYEQVPSLSARPLSERLSVTVILYPPDNRKRDTDNYLKALFDALTHAHVWDDDQLVDSHSVYRGVTLPKPGAARIRITEAGPLLPNTPKAFDFIGS